MIRPFTAEDRENYLAMAMEFMDSPAILHPIPQSYLEQNFQTAISESPFLKGYLFADEKTAMGYAMVSFSYSTERAGLLLWVEELYIRPAYRGQGLGTAFFRFVKEEFGVKGYRLEVAPDNPRAAALYERLGYRDVVYRQMFAPYLQIEEEH